MCKEDGIVENKQCTCGEKCGKMVSQEKMQERYGDYMLRRMREEDAREMSMVTNKDYEV
jgi:hypothetical protein